MLYKWILMLEHVRLVNLGENVQTCDFLKNTLEFAQPVCLQNGKVWETAIFSVLTDYGQS